MGSCLQCANNGTAVFIKHIALFQVQVQGFLPHPSERKPRNRDPDPLCGDQRVCGPSGRRRPEVGLQVDSHVLQLARDSPCTCPMSVRPQASRPGRRTPARHTKPRAQ